MGEIRRVSWVLDEQRLDHVQIFGLLKRTIFVKFIYGCVRIIPRGSERIRNSIPDPVKPIGSGNNK